MSIGQLVNNILETIDISNPAQKAKKMRDKNISSLVAIDDHNKGIGIVPERDLVRKVSFKPFCKKFLQLL